MINFSKLNKSLNQAVLIKNISEQASNADTVRATIINSGKLPKMAAMSIAHLNSPQGATYSITFPDGSNLLLDAKKFSITEIQQNFGVDLPETIKRKESEKTNKIIQNTISTNETKSTPQLNNTQDVIVIGKRYDFYFSKNSFTTKFLAVKNQNFQITGYNILVHSAVETSKHIILSLTVKAIPNNSNTVQVGFIAAAAIIAGLSVITGITAIIFLEKFEESPIVAISILPLVIFGFILARKFFS